MKGQILIEFIDNGPGMSEHDCTAAVDPFFSTRAQNFGLGLALVNRIITEHGGELEVESEPGEKGWTSFWPCPSIPGRLRPRKGRSRRGPPLYNSVAGGQDRGLGGGGVRSFTPSLFEDVNRVAFDRVGADKKKIGYFQVGETFGHEFQDLDLPFRSVRNCPVVSIGGGSGGVRSFSARFSELSSLFDIAELFFQVVFHSLAVLISRVTVETISPSRFKTG